MLGLTVAAPNPSRKEWGARGSRLGAPDLADQRRILARGKVVRGGGGGRWEGEVATDDNLFWGATIGRRRRMPEGDGSGQGGVWGGWPWTPVRSPVGGALGGRERVKLEPFRPFPFSCFHFYPHFLHTWPSSRISCFIQPCISHFLGIYHEAGQKHEQ